MKQFETAYDVVVVGAGGGGLRAAIGAAERGAKTLVVCRGKANRSGATLLAGANISADIACDGATLSRLNISHGKKDDTLDDWFYDVVREGFYLNNQDLVQLFVETAGQRLEELVNWGMEIRGMEGEREVSVFGSDILDALYGHARALGVEFLPDTLFTDLALRDGQVCGAVCDAGDRRDSDHKCQGRGAGHRRRAQSVCVQQRLHRSVRRGSGGGLAGRRRAHRYGDDLLLPHRHPLSHHVPGNILPYIFITTGYGSLLNKFGKTFTNRYLPPKVEQLALESEWNKMLLSYAVQSEILAGRGAKDGGVYFSLPNHPAEILEELYTDLPPAENRYVCRYHEDL